MSVFAFFLTKLRLKPTKGRVKLKRSARGQYEGAHAASLANEAARAPSYRLLADRFSVAWALVGFKRSFVRLLVYGLAATTTAVLLAEEPDPPLHARTHPARQIIPLNGDWLFQTNGAPSNLWKNVQVPAPFENHEGTNFNGIGWYKKNLASIPLAPNCRALLHFQAAAADAEIAWNGHPLGSHLGAWTPFRFDVTEHLACSPPPTNHLIQVQLDEKVGHNTQGFLPVIQPHFGGLWQDVQLLIVPETYIDDLQLKATGNTRTGEFELEFPVCGSHRQLAPITIRYRLLGTTDWQTTLIHPLAADPAHQPQNQLISQIDAPSLPATGQPNATISAPFHQTGPEPASIISITLPIPNPELWSPTHPHLYEIHIELPPTPSNQTGDTVTARAAFRDISTAGPQLLLNGQPLNIRGLLNWGYHPPLLAPTPSEDQIRADLAFVRACGFNLMKFCLWIPPKRYLELADEMGVLTWIEYPTWHPQFTTENLTALLTEFREFFAYDRNHPSVILRSLTCETGPGAEFSVLQSLYTTAHQMIPNALIEDDSSWIEWNRISDFYDDHPYGNNHTWIPTLQRLNQFILAHGLKPLVLGEAIAADTWAPHQPPAEKLGPDRPFWAPQSFDHQQLWLDQMTRIAGPDSILNLLPDSLNYALLMRKFQAESFRREVPYGGYVISVIRDISTASMGLLDYFGQPKWQTDDWAWQRDTICLLQTDGVQRAFRAGQTLNAELSISHFGPTPLTNASLQVKLELPATGTILHQTNVIIPLQKPGTLAQILQLSTSLQIPLTPTNTPVPLLLQTTLNSNQRRFTNAWPLWIVPPAPSLTTTPIWLHPSMPDKLGHDLFPESRPLIQPGADGVIVARRFDDLLLDAFERGGRVLLLPDGQRHSLPLKNHWFLQGAPLLPQSTLTKTVPRRFLLELQHFDLADSVIPDLPYLEEVDPILLLWDTHGWDHVKTHGLVFSTRAAAGRLTVSALNHSGARNPAGHWLLQQLVQDLATGPLPTHSLSPETWNQLKLQLHEKKILLTERPWRFHPDPDNQGLPQGWHLPQNPDSDWPHIRIGQSWESQGFPALDGWAWYRIPMQIPPDWPDVYLTFTGVDDLYELYLDGNLIAQCGDLATRQTTFFETRSHCLTHKISPNRTALVAVRVHDWFGAGGIFKPVMLSTRPLNPILRILKD